MITSKLENPPLMVIAGMRWRHPFGLFFYRGRRWSRFRKALLASPGLLLYQESSLHPQGFPPLPRTFLALSWWRDRKSLKAWYNHPEHQEIVQWAEAGRTGFDLWIEEYILREPGQYRGVAGGLKAALEEKGVELIKVSSGSG